MYKRILSFTLALVITLSLVPYTAFADGSVRPVGAGTGTGTYSTSSIFTWDGDHQGLRFSVIDNTGKTVLTNQSVVDIQLSEVPSNNLSFWNNKFGSIADNNSFLAMSDKQITEYVAKQLLLDNPKLLAATTTSDSYPISESDLRINASGQYNDPAKAAKAIEIFCDNFSIPGPLVNTGGAYSSNQQAIVAWFVNQQKYTTLSGKITSEEVINGSLGEFENALSGISGSSSGEGSTDDKYKEIMDKLSAYDASRASIDLFKYSPLLTAEEKVRFCDFQRSVLNGLVGSGARYGELNSLLTNCWLELRKPDGFTLGDRYDCDYWWNYILRIIHDTQNLNASGTLKQISNISSFYKNDLGEYAYELYYPYNDSLVTNIANEVTLLIRDFADSKLPSALDIFTGDISVDYYLACKTYLDNLNVIFNERIKEVLVYSIGSSNFNNYSSGLYRIDSDKCTVQDMMEFLSLISILRNDMLINDDIWVVTPDEMVPLNNNQLKHSYTDYLEYLGGDMYGTEYYIGQYQGEKIYTKYPYTIAQTNYISNILANEVKQYGSGGDKYLAWEASTLHKITSYLGMSITEDEIAKTMAKESNQYYIDNTKLTWTESMGYYESPYPFDNENISNVNTWYYNIVGTLNFCSAIDTKAQSVLFITGSCLMEANGDVSHFLLGTLLANAMELAINKNVTAGVWDIEAVNSAKYISDQENRFNSSFAQGTDKPVADKMLSLIDYIAITIVDNANVKAESYNDALNKVKLDIYEMYGALNSDNTPNNEKMYEIFLAQVCQITDWNTSRDYNSDWFASHQFIEWALQTAIKVVRELYANGSLDEVVEEYSKEDGSNKLLWDSDESGIYIGFIKYFLNSVGPDGKYIFEVKHDPDKQASYEAFMAENYGDDWKTTKDTPANRFQYYGYKLMIEPLMWFVPKVYWRDEDVYNVTSSLGLFWYGTPTNWIEWTNLPIASVYKDEKTMWSYKPLFSNSLYVDDTEYTKLIDSGYTGSFDGNKGIIIPAKRPMTTSRGNSALYTDFYDNNVGFAVNFLFAGVPSDEVDLTTRTDDPSLVAAAKGGEAPDKFSELADMIGKVMADYPDEVYNEVDRFIHKIPAPNSLRVKALKTFDNIATVIAQDINTGDDYFVTECDHIIVKYYELEIYDQNDVLVDTKYGRIEPTWNETTKYEDVYGVESPSNYYIRLFNPRVIDINDELLSSNTYLVEDWFTTTQDNYTNYLNDYFGLGETYDDYKAKVTDTIQSGTSSQQNVTLKAANSSGDNIEKVLVVKLKAKKYQNNSTPPIAAADKITESQITKAISTADSTSTRAWAGYEFISNIQEFTNTSHTYIYHRGCTHSCNNRNCTHSCDGHCGCSGATCYGVSRANHSDNKISETYSLLSGDDRRFEIRSAGTSIASELLGYVLGNNGQAEISSPKSETIKFGDRTIGDAADTFTVTSGTDANGVLYATTIWRGGDDIGDTVTLAKYKSNAMSAHAQAVLRSIIGEANKNPTARETNGVKTSRIVINLGHSAWDAVTKAKCISTTGCSHPDGETTTPDVTYTIQIPASLTGVTYDPSGHWIQFEGDMEVDIYAGDTSKKSTIANDTPSMTSSGWPASHSSGTATNSSVWFRQMNTSDTIKFNPYIRMSFMETKDAVTASYSYKDYDRNVYVLSDNLSQILPSNAVEVSWYNYMQEHENKYGIQMQSAQWSTHKSATDGTANWKKVNQVLPGGAIYTLNTQGSETNVKVVTYNTLVDPSCSDWLTIRDVYKSQNILSNTSGFFDEVRKNLEHFRMAQWVTWDTNSTKAWEDSSKAVSILDGNESLNNLNNPNTNADNTISGTKSSTDDKYRLVADDLATPNDKGSSEGDIDIKREYHTTNVYKAFTDIQGDIYVATITLNTVYDEFTKVQLDKAVETLSPVCGTNLAGKGSTPAPSLTDIQAVLGSDDTVTYRIDIIGNKNHTPDQIKQILQNNFNTLYWMNEKTMFITNVIKSVERNTGNDTNATWLNNNDGKWYNEAFDGIYMVEQTTTFVMGLEQPNKRVAALDPSLCPPKSGTGDTYSMAYMSQFCIHPKSTTAPAGKADGYIGAINLGNGIVDVAIPNVQEMLYSREFYIPNANVQDLN